MHIGTYLMVRKPFKVMYVLSYAMSILYARVFINVINLHYKLSELDLHELRTRIAR